MPALLTSGSTTLSPIALSAYSSSQDGGTILHPILGRSGADVTLRPTGMRVGSFMIDFRTAALAEAARAALSVATTWMLSHSEQTTLNMRFIVRTVDREVSGNGRWGVAVRFEEIP